VAESYVNKQKERPVLHVKLTMIVHASLRKKKKKTVKKTRKRSGKGG
jgi:hypothetical protein